MCLPGRMDRRWKGLLCHQQLPAAHRGRVPRKCHLRICWAGSGTSSDIHCHLRHQSSPILLCQCFLAFFLPQILLSLPATRLFPHGALYPKQSPSVPIPVLPPTWRCSGSKYFLVSTLVDVRHKGLLEILISVIPLKSMELHRNRETNSPRLEYAHYFNHFNELLCFIEMTE